MDKKGGAFFSILFSVACPIEEVNKSKPIGGINMFDEINIINRVATGDIIRRAARRFPDKTAVVDGNIRLTYTEFDQMTNQYAHYLKSIGLKKGDSVATIAINSVGHLLTMFGVQKAGLVWVPINPGISIEDQRYILEKSDAKLIVADYPVVAHNLPELTEYSFLFTADHEVEEAKTIQEAIANQPMTELDVHIEDRDLAQIMFTSGTTGNPKGVMISHLSVYLASLSNIIDTQFKEDDVCSVLMPMFHCAQHTFIASNFHIGGTAVVFREFEPTNVMETIAQEKISFFFALPMMYRALIHHPNRSDFDLSSLRKAVYAMAPMDRPTLERGIKELEVDFLLGTGQTEMYPGTMFFKPEDQLTKVGSYWGNTAIINDTAVMDDDGNLLPAGEVGEIVHRGPNVMMGYLDNEEDTKEAREFGWHHTGDLGYWDEDGLMVFVDRKNDIIKTGGENVASVRVESAILAHNKVENVGVIGLDHDHWEEAVTAIVMLKEGEEATEKEILNHCREHLNGFEVPKAVRFMEALPMTTTGKVQKHLLREQFANLYEEIEEQA